ncbi:MAG: exodeoxyribonuclease VII small subunit [Deltaproteobacteria bacterium]|nr:exodeoxyribonuclease VII small subunit [Deltaproteobacteria bacterium]
MADMKFEEALERLEKIVRDMEGGSLSLEDSLTAFEQGIKLCRLMAKKLDESERKVKLLLKEEGKLVIKDFSAEDLRDE